ncbi:hypothetical protein EV356DRAFT_496606 [Viridothelium virens]|uniref:Flagellar protein FlgN n=1 Tax=Viridothelium virens TaxID=1048519 RepID=A0A6A6GTX4_VIRVR|nr:hypothetical protein EV356DRAFT_496606 [Viridothelium virens]
MDQSLRNAPALLARIDTATQQLIRRFENLIGLASLEKTDRNSTALNALEIDVETAALIRGAEDLTTLIRQMQEVWLFGELNTLGKSENQEKMQQSTVAVAELLNKVLSSYGREATQAEV